MFLRSHLTIQSIFILYKQFIALRSTILPSYGFVLIFICLNVSAQENDWELSGTFVGSKISHAMFVDTQGNDVLVKLGDYIENCKLVDVLNGSVKLRCNSSEVTLLLRNSVGDLTNPTRYENLVTNQKSISLSRKEISKFVKNKQRLVSEFEFLPIHNEQKIIGYELSRIHPNSQVAQLGLHNGDIVTSINGIPASDTLQFMHGLNELKDLSNITVQVDRYGQIYAYTYLLE